ncbi:MAG: hypothetical protein ABJI60_00250 [Kangiellaceae bacterium]
MHSLKELAKDGMLGKVYITMHAERVAELLGEPDYKGGGSRKHKWENIFRYGSFELGFEIKSRELNYFAINFAQEFEKAKALEYDLWILSPNLRSSEFESLCKSQEVEFKQFDEPWNEGCIEYLTEGGMHLCFDENDRLTKFVVSDGEYS